jgi:hypothetical protein
MFINVELSFFKSLILMKQSNFLCHIAVTLPIKALRLIFVPIFPVILLAAYWNWCLQKCMIKTIDIGLLNLLKA